VATLKILIVDDDDASIAIVSAGLRKLGFQIVVATDGWDGLSQARKERPDLVLLDVKMPQMDGWTFIGILRGQKDFEKTPVIFLTGRTSDEDRKKGLSLGADDYLTKPVEFDRLRASIQKVLDKRAKDRATALREKAAETARPSGRFGLRGRLDQLGVAALLSILGAGKRTGTLTIADAGGQKGLVSIRDGRVETVQILGSDPPLEGLGAMDALGKWREGEFFFHERAVSRSNASSTQIPKI
jgi:CheY-like chemotaxis protein